MKADDSKEQLRELTTHFLRLREIMLNDFLELGDELLNIPSTRIQRYVRDYPQNCFLEVSDAGRRRQLLAAAETKTDQELFLTLSSMSLLTKSNLPPSNVELARHPDERENNNLCNVVFDSCNVRGHLDKKSKGFYELLMEYQFDELDTYTSSAILQSMIQITASQSSLLGLVDCFSALFARLHSESSSSHNLVFDHMHYIMENSPYHCIYQSRSDYFSELNIMDVIEHFNFTFDALSTSIDSANIIIQLAPTTDEIDEVSIHNVLNKYVRTLQAVIKILTKVNDIVQNIKETPLYENEESPELSPRPFGGSSW